MRDLDRFCCVNCFDEPNIKKHIHEFSTSTGDCEYCGSKDLRIMHLEEVSDFIVKCVFRKYEDPANEVAYVSAEGGYQIEIWTLADVLTELENVFSEAVKEPYVLGTDLDFTGSQYVRKEPYGPASGGREEILKWKSFCHHVKHNQRFTLFEARKETVPTETDFAGNLQAIADLLHDKCLLTIHKGTLIYRARIAEPSGGFGHQDLTSVSPDKSRNNRMSPPGISFFYGAEAREVSIAETRPSLGETVTVAEFEVIRDLTAINLVNWLYPAHYIDEPISIFDDWYDFEHEEFHRPFLKHFIHEISKPVRPGDAEIEYVPTQVMTEFIRMRVFKDSLGLEREEEVKESQVHGLMFSSSILKEGGINYVLFEGPNISTESMEKPGESWLLYKGKKEYQITGVGVEFREVNQTESEPFQGTHENSET